MPQPFGLRPLGYGAAGRQRRCRASRPSSRVIASFSISTWKVLVAVVRTETADAIRKRDEHGERQFLHIRVSKGQLAAIRLAVLHALAIARLVVRAVRRSDNVSV